MKWRCNRRSALHEHIRNPVRSGVYLRMGVNRTARLNFALDQVEMDCREFRKQHVAYLDDTLPGDDMASAQRHLMACDGCAAHDNLVRRSLMLVRNVTELQVSGDFRLRMQQRLTEARAETQRGGLRLVSQPPRPAPHTSARQPIIFSAMAAGVLIMGTMVWRQATTSEATAIVLQAVTVTQPAPDTMEQVIYPPSMVRAMSTGNPMWPAAVLVDDTPAQLVNSELIPVRLERQ